EHVVEESVAAARRDMAQRSLLAAEHEECSRRRTTRDAAADGAELLLDKCGGGLRSRLRADPHTQGAHRLGDVGQAAVNVRKDGHPRAFELTLQVGLRDGGSGGRRRTYRAAA